MKELLEYLKYSKELTINPFGLGKASCNNRCKFCIISNRLLNIDVPLEYFIETTNNTKKWLNKYIDILPEDLTITFFFVAGELFYMNKDYFDLYEKTAQELVEIAKKKYNKIKFNIQSNLLSPNKEVLDNFIKLSKTLLELTPNVIITTSFDLWGRFNDNTLNIWKNNLLYIQNKLQTKIMVEVILTEPGTKEYIINNNESTKTLDFILENEDKFNVSFEDFILNNPENSNLYPQLDNLIEFYKKVNSKFPDHHVLDMYKHPVKDFHINNSKPRAECILIQFSDKPFNNGLTYTDEDLRIINKNCLGGTLSNISNYPLEEILKFIPKNNNGLYCLHNTEEVLNYFENKLGCAYCKYKPYCSPKCFIQYIVKYHSERCQRKELFKLLRND